MGPDGGPPEVDAVDVPRCAVEPAVLRESRLSGRRRRKVAAAAPPVGGDGTLPGTADRSSRRDGAAASGCLRGVAAWSAGRLRTRADARGTRARAGPGRHS